MKTMTRSTSNVAPASCAALALSCFLACTLSTNAQTATATPRIEPGVPLQLTLPAAIALALEHNRRLLLAHDHVLDEKEQRRIAASHLYPTLRNESAVLHLTELEGITVPAGSLAASSLIGPLPGASLVIDQGAATSYTSGTELAQPFTQILRIRAGVRAADADLHTAEIQSNGAGLETAVAVHKLYFEVLLEQMRAVSSREAVNAASLLQEETHRGVQQGRLLEDAELASEADALDKQQATLVSRLTLDNLYLQLDDLLGLPLGTKLQLDPDALGNDPEVPTRADALVFALQHSPAVLVARQSLDKAKAGASVARDAYLPDITGLARYSYQSGLPFLAHNFGTFGATLTWNLFDGNAREATLRDSRIRLSMAEKQLQQSENDVCLEVSAAYDQAEQLEQLRAVTSKASAAREESLRIQTKRAQAGAELTSGVAAARAALASSRVKELSARLGLLLARDEIRKLLGENTD
jgi:outer membrane protein TolC